MKLHRWLRKFLPRTKGSKQPTPGRRPRRKHLQVEQLEGRLLPSFTFNTLASFYPNAGNIFSPNSLVADTNGDLFGTTANGGTNGNGAVFEIPKGTTTINTLASFGAFTGGSEFSQTNSSGATPASESLVIDGNGNLFGATTQGGVNGLGTIFEVVAGSDNITPLASFDQSVTGDSEFEGGNPGTKLVLYNGNLFGINQGGGANSAGTVFEIPASSNSDTITVLAAFNGTNGDDPNSLAVDASGNLFGTTYYGGPATATNGGAGVIFEVPQGGTSITPLTSFSLTTPGTQFLGNLIVDGNDNLFATMAPDYQSGHGEVGPTTIFELPQGGTSITTVASFGNNISSVPFPTTLVEDANGNFFGTTETSTNSGGTLFEVANGSGSISTLTTFGTTVASGGDNGDNPDALIQSNGNLFGTTQKGGFDGPSGEGTVFDLAASTTTDTWTGAGKLKNGAPDPRWSNPDNWDNGVPQNGEDVDFPAGVAQMHVVNDIADFQPGTVEIDDSYQIDGLALDPAGIDVTGGDPVIATVDAESTAGSASATAGRFDNPAPDQNPWNVEAGDLKIGDLQGNETVLKQGAGTADIRREMTYTGTTTLQAGVLTLGGDLPASANLDINVPTGTATINTVAALNLKDTVNFQGGNLNVTGKGFTLSGPVTVSAATTISPAANVTV